MVHASGKEFEFPPKMLEATGVYKIVVDELSCKIHE
jgi:hypothetical protein